MEEEEELRKKEEEKIKAELERKRTNNSWS